MVYRFIGKEMVENHFRASSGHLFCVHGPILPVSEVYHRSNVVEIVVHESGTLKIAKLNKHTSNSTLIYLITFKRKIACILTIKFGNRLRASCQIKK